MFFETVTVKEVNEEINYEFKIWLDGLVKQKDKGFQSSEFQNQIDFKLAELYSLSREDVKLIDRSEGVDNEEDLSIISLSQLANS